MNTIKNFSCAKNNFRAAYVTKGRKFVVQCGQVAFRITRKSLLQSLTHVGKTGTIEGFTYEGNNIYVTLTNIKF